MHGERSWFEMFLTKRRLQQPRENWSLNGIRGVFYTARHRVRWLVTCTFNPQLTGCPFLTCARLKYCVLLDSLHFAYPFVSFLFYPFYQFYSTSPNHLFIISGDQSECIILAATTLLPLLFTPKTFSPPNLNLSSLSLSKGSKEKAFIKGWFFAFVSISTQ